MTRVYGCIRSDAHDSFPRPSITSHTVGKPVTSPKTNLVVQPKDVLLLPNVTVRSLVLEFKEATTREWEEAEQRWREQGGEGRGEGRKGERRWADVAGGGRGGVEG